MAGEKRWGVALRDYPQNGWEGDYHIHLLLYNNYVHTFSSFNSCRRSLLWAMSSTDVPKNIPIDTGYGMNSFLSLLLLFISSDENQFPFWGWEWSATIMNTLNFATIGHLHHCVIVHLLFKMYLSVASN